METNYFGAIALTKAVAPYMVNKKSGHLVAVASLAGLVGGPYRMGYSGAKFAITGYYESLRSELNNYGVEV